MRAAIPHAYEQHYVIECSYHIPCMLQNFQEVVKSD